jgi:hypothetical protein
MSISHDHYKKMKILQGKYYKLKNGGPGGIRQDCYDNMLLKYKYDFLKKRLEYLTASKEEDYYRRLDAFSYQDAVDLVTNKLKNDTELIQLRRVIFIIKLQLLNTGYQKIYL